MKVLIALFILFEVKAMSFNEALESLKNHPLVLFHHHHGEMEKALGEKMASWGDPKFKIAAKNLPKDSLDRDKTPMSGIEFSLAQKFALTNRYGKQRQSGEARNEMHQELSKDRLQFLKKSLWIELIERKKIKEIIIILEENLAWNNKILSVSKKLYANGRLSQKAILDVQIRKSEIESQLESTKLDLTQQKQKIAYLIQSNENIEPDSIPWTSLDDESKTEKRDPRELALKKNIESARLEVEAAKLAYIPDPTISIGYTKRSNIDGNGDFVSASIQIPLPFSDNASASLGKNLASKMVAEKELKNYQLSKSKDASIASREIQKLTKELEILSSKTLKFAKSSREITAKSYGLGSTSYTDLLQSELKLQEILMRRVSLTSKKLSQLITLKYLLGEKLP